MPFKCLELLNDEIVTLQASITFICVSLNCSLQLLFEQQITNQINSSLIFI
jgi:hypothetical protein